VTIHRHFEGRFIATDSRHDAAHEIERLMDLNEWATCDCEDVSGHPVISRQLRALRAADANGFSELTDKAFTAQELAAACEANEISV